MNKQSGERDEKSAAECIETVAKQKLLHKREHGDRQKDTRGRERHRKGENKE